MNKITDSFLRKLENQPRVIAWWYDAEGKKTQHAAILQSGYGYYFSHVLYSSNRVEKAKFLRALYVFHDKTFRKEFLLGQWRKLLAIGWRLEDDPTAFRVKVFPEIIQSLKNHGWHIEQVETILQGHVPNGGVSQIIKFVEDLDRVKAERIGNNIFRMHLYYFDGVPCSELAGTIVKQNETALRKRMSRLRDWLRECIQRTLRAGEPGDQADDD